MAKISVKKPTRLIYHNPVCLITSRHGSYENVFTLSWITAVSNNPPMLAISVRNSRFSHDLILKSNSFAVNVPDVSMLDKVIYCGNVSGKDKNKFRELKLEKKITANGSIILPECIAYIECRVSDQICAGDHTVFIAKIIDAAVDEGLFEGNLWKDKPESEVLFYLGDGKYSTLKRF